MPNLTETTYYARKTLKLTLIVIVGYITLQILITNAIKLYKYLNPPPPPPPTVGFGLLSSVTFPDNPGYDFQFKLETPTGTFPSFPDRANVYAMPPQQASLLALEQSTKLATKLLFAGEPKDLSSSIYEWTRNIPAPFTLRVNGLDGTFSLSYQWQTDSSILMERQLPGRERAIMLARSFLASIDKVNPDIDFENGVVTYLKASGNKLVVASSLSQADFVKVDFFRNDIDMLDVVTPNPNQGIISMVFSGSTKTEKQIISATYNYFTIHYPSPETYPLKPVALAWEELRGGKAFIAKKLDDTKEITIRRIYLAYYDSPQPQLFMQPVYLFLDDPDNPSFTAYVSAVSDEYIDKTSQ